MTPLFISESHVIPHPCLCGRNVRVSSIHRMKRLREYNISSNKDPLRKVQMAMLVQPAPSIQNGAMNPWS